MTDKELFEGKVIPILDSVAKDLRAKQVEEYRKEAFSLRGILAGASGPDGGMAADSALYQNLKITGEWSSKTVEDYVQMVKSELKRQKIDVTPELEKMMIDLFIFSNITYRFFYRYKSIFKLDGGFLPLIPK